MYGCSNMFAACGAHTLRTCVPGLLCTLYVIISAHSSWNGRKRPLQSIPYFDCRFNAIKLVPCRVLCKRFLAPPCRAAPKIVYTKLGMAPPFVCLMIATRVDQARYPPLV